MIHKILLLIAIIFWPLVFIPLFYFITNEILREGLGMIITMIWFCILMGFPDYETGDGWH